MDKSNATEITTLNTLIILQGDIHINARASFEFESNRLSYLSTLYLDTVKNTSYKPTLFLLGDVFDSDNPTFEEVRLFYKFIDSLKESFSIYIISGNHDSTIFNYLPHAGFDYIHTYREFKTPEGNPIVAVSWEYLPTFLKAEYKRYNNHTLLTHARCDLGVHIKQEVDFELISKHFPQTYLGDIHQPYKPYPNVEYTSSPSAITFSNQQHEHGFLLWAGNKTTFISTKGMPTRIVKQLSVDEAIAFITNLKDNPNLYKVKIEGTAEELNKLVGVTHKRVIKDLKQQVESLEDIESESLEQIKAFLFAKADVTQFLFDFIQEKFKLTNADKVRLINMYRQYLFKKNKKSKTQ